MKLLTLSELSNFNIKISKQEFMKYITKVKKYINCPRLYNNDFQKQLNNKLVEYLQLFNSIDNKQKQIILFIISAFYNLTNIYKTYSVSKLANYYIKLVINANEELNNGNALQKLKIFENSKDNELDFEITYLIKQGNKKIPTIAFNLQTETDTGDNYKTSFAALGFVIDNIFYECNNLVLDDFFKNNNIKEKFLKKLTNDKIINCDFCSKSGTDYEDLDFDSDEEDILYDNGFDSDVVLKELEKTADKIYS